MILCSKEELGASALRRKVSWGLTCKTAVFGSEGVLERCGNLLSCSVFAGFVKPSEVRGARRVTELFGPLS